MTSVEFRSIPDPESDPEPDFTAGPARAEFDSSPGDGDYRCEVCGDLISTPSGRKPRVMLCETHKKNKTPTANTKSPNPRTHAKIAEGMTAFHVIVGMLVGSVYIPTRDEVWLQDKNTIQGQAESLGEAWAKVTDQDPKLRRKVEKFLESFGVLTLAAAYAPVAVGIATNHTQAQQAKQATQPDRPMGLVV